MENQHRKISGYRELNQNEIDAMNQIKAQGQQVGDMIDGLADHSTQILDGWPSQKRICRKVLWP